ncbi:MAG: G-Protein alpha subunit [Sarea resinae]|nr:MAG: G-Protein alpha subunit [Sarea resinae]
MGLSSLFSACFGSKNEADDQAGVARSQEIDKLIRNDGKKLKSEVKLLLLGAGESGKSTVLKQMRLMHAEGFSKNERKEWRAIIFSNIVNAFKVIFEAMEDYDLSFENPANSASAELVLADPDLHPDQPLPTEYLAAFRALWNDEGIKQAIQKGNEYALHDNLFFVDLDRLFVKDYIPTDQDVLRSRLRTTGITETVFELGALTYRMFDVGGQRSERKKWIHCFENVTCLLFLVAISGYDQCLVEDKDGNQMNEALMLFESIVNSQWFRQSATILFLNKIDLFKGKLATSPISRYFPDYNDGDTNFDGAKKYFAEKFRNLNRNPNKEVYVHFTNATDTNLLKITMTSVQDIIVQRNLSSLVL